MKKEFVNESNMKKIFTKTKVFFTLGYLVFLMVYAYVTLPFINLKAQSFYMFLAFILVLPITLYFIHRFENMDGDELVKKFTISKDTGKLKQVVVSASNTNPIMQSFPIVFIGAIITGIVLIIVLNIFSAKIFTSKLYAKQLPIEMQDQTSLNTTFDYEAGDVQLPRIDKDLAFKLAQARLGDYGSQFTIDYENFTIISVERNGGTELIRVTPLEYSTTFVSIAKMNEGSIGYIEVNVITKEAKLIEVDGGLKYLPSGILKYDLDRHIRTKFPTEMYQNKYFEIDNEGNPYWVIPTIKKAIGVFGGLTPKGVILVNATTGEAVNYKLGEQPKWVQRCVDERVVEEQANNALYYKNGYFNTLFAKKDMFTLSDGYNYLLRDNATYYISCITSPNENDQTSIGFIIINLKTKEAFRYSSPGITEMRAREIAMYDERVKAQNLDSTWPVLVSYHGVPTYFVILKNDVQPQKFVLVNVHDGTLIGMGNTLQEAETAYDSILSNQGTIQKNDKVISGKVVAIRDLGNTIEFMLDTDNDSYFTVDVSISLDARFLKVGDDIEVVYKEYSSYNYVTELNKK